MFTKPRGTAGMACNEFDHVFYKLYTALVVLARTSMLAINALSMVNVDVSSAVLQTKQYRNFQSE